MEMILLAAWALIATVAAGLFYKKSLGQPAPASLPSSPGKGALSASSAADEALKATEKKLADVRAELATLKEKLTSKQRELDELREQQKAKARREGKKEASVTGEKKGPDPRDVEIQSLRKGMAALESQLNTLKRESAALGAREADLTSKANADVEGAKKAAETERERRERIESENAKLKATIDELRAAIKKVDARPDVPGTTIDLKSLPTPVVQELARFFRKGEEFERLYTVAQSQLQLEKDRTLEIQRRYFAVCRELAVHAGVSSSAPTGEAVAAAEAVIDGEVKIETKPAEGGAAGEGKKKRRRRRRRKIAGEPSEAAEGDDTEGDDGHGDDLEASAEGAPVDEGGNGSGAAAQA
jgi:hypothetical protein